MFWEVGHGGSALGSIEKRPFFLLGRTVAWHIQCIVEVGEELRRTYIVHICAGEKVLGEKRFFFFRDA